MTFILSSEVEVLVAQLCLTLCDPMDYSPPGSSVHGILQARILEWIAIPFSRNLPDTRMNLVSCTVSRFFTIWAIREAPGCWCCREKWIRIPCWSCFFDSLFIVFIVILLFISLIILFISAMSVVISTFPFLILLNCFFSLLFLISLANGLPNLFIFSTNQF